MKSHRRLCRVCGPAGDAIPSQYSLDAGFCELSQPPTAGQCTEELVMYDRQAASVFLADRPERTVRVRAGVAVRHRKG